MSAAEQLSCRPHLQSNLPLWGILAFGLTLRLFYFVGVSGWDDVDYFRYAVEAKEGTFSTQFEPNGSFPFRFRLGLIWPTAIMFRMFGTSEVVASILPLCVSLGTIVLTWLAGNRISRRCGTYAALLMATFPLSVVQATTLEAGPFATFLIAVSILWFLKINDATTKQKLPPIGPSYAAGIMLGLAYFYRIEAGLFAMFFVGYAIYRPASLRSCLFALAGAASVVAVETLVYLALHGEFLYRLKAISGGFSETATELSTAVTDKKSPLEYLILIFLKPVDLGLHWAAASVAVVYCTAFARHNRAAFLIWFWPVTLYLFFGSWSLSSYVPTTKNPRYLLIVSIPAFVMLASLIADWHNRTGKLRSLATAVMAATIAGSLALTNITFAYRYENASGARQAAAFIRSTDEGGKERRTVWSDHHGALAIACLLPEYEVRALNFHDLSVGADVSLADVDQLKEGYVFADRFVLQKYADHAQMAIPDYVQNPPAHWTEIHTAQHPRKGVAYSVCRAIDCLVQGRVGGLKASLNADAYSVWKINATQQP